MNKRNFFVFQVQPNNYASFYDDGRTSWSLMFDKADALVAFAKQVRKHIILCDLFKDYCIKISCEGVDLNIFCPPPPAIIELHDYPLLHNQISFNPPLLP